MKVLSLFISGLFLLFCRAYAVAHEIDTAVPFGQDSCNVNDICETAIPIVGVFTGDPFLCITGCNSTALPEAFNNPCGLGDFPTTWYRIQTDDAATLMNIFVNSSDLQAPAVSLFLETTNCSALTPVPMTQSNLQCILGSNGEAEALGTRVGANTVYYIAVTGMQDQGGNFELCINTIANASGCVVDRNIEITARSTGGPLEGPYLPGETVSVCFHVNSYTAANNGCQWFQGLVPVFGLGWDPSSYDAYGQPLNASINGHPIGQNNNGIFSTATWDWFADVDYHHNDDIRQVGDFDGNGTLDICSTLYDPECPNTGGLKAACCNPCWGSPLGTILPPGWFAYGVNGSCGTPGPPVRVDWGDGNTCGGGMGPWSFCFDLKVKYDFVCGIESPDNLSLGFFTFADGETGAWTGSASVCAQDQPVQLRLPVECGPRIDQGIEYLPDVCKEGEFLYQISSSGIEHWRWNVSPIGAMSDSVFEGPDGHVIHSQIIRQQSTPFDVVYTFVGSANGTDTLTIRRVQFTVWPEINLDLQPELRICERETDTLYLTPRTLTGGNGVYTFAWTWQGQTDDTLVLYPPHQPNTIGLVVTDQTGCLETDIVRVILKPCLGDTMDPADENNDTPKPDDPPAPDGNISSPSIPLFQRVSDRPNGLQQDEIEIKVYPVPTTSIAFVDWSVTLHTHATIDIFNSHGVRIDQIHVNPEDGHRKRINTESMFPGIYFISLSNGAFRVVTKLVKL